MTFDNAATVLAERIEALAIALRVAGVPPERSADLLAAAATAAMRALTLHALLDEPAAPALPIAARPGEPPLPLAA